jgi:hypothetical protein
LGVKLSGGLLAFLATSVAFTYCGWYEVLELWDEYFWSHFERIHTWDDTPNDLFYDFLGVIAFIGAAALIFAAKERLAKPSSAKLVLVRLRNLASTLPGDLLGFFVATIAFGLCCWFEIFRMFDQRWFGRIHLVGNRDSAIYLQWELAACVTLAIVLVAVFKRLLTRKASAA